MKKKENKNINKYSAYDLSQLRYNKNSNDFGELPSAYDLNYRSVHNWDHNEKYNLHWI